MLHNLFSLTFEDFKSLCDEKFINPIHALEFYKRHYKLKKNKSLQFSNEFIHFINKHISQDLPKIHTINKSDDQTVKFLLKLNDDEYIETVLIPFNKKYTICLSTQVGCAMNCSFCFTGKMGLKRNLNTEEIIGQYMVGFQYLKENIHPLSPEPNIVFMGQGEPLHNFEMVKKAISIFLDKNGLSLSQKKITLSTAGYLPGLLRFHELNSVNLALSLHSVKDKLRNELIPINQKYSLQEVLNVLKTIPLLKKQFINIEYLLIKDLNDSDEDAKLLAEKIHSLKAIVNLIPYNPIPNLGYEKPSIDRVENFKKVLVKEHIPTMIRTTKGDEILAACGQLNSRYAKSTSPLPR